MEADGQIRPETRPDGWYPDLTGRHELRFLQSGRWSDHVSDGGHAASDPISVVPVRPDPQANLLTRRFAVGAQYNVPSASSDWLDQVAVSLASLPRHQVATVTRGALQVTRLGPSVVRIVLAIGCFPIGLLALIGAGTRTGTIQFNRDSAGSAWVLAEGAFSNDARRMISAAVANAGGDVDPTEGGTGLGKASLVLLGVVVVTMLLVFLFVNLSLAR